MSAPEDRPLSLARLRALPVGARIRDRHGRVWRRTADPLGKPARPGWFRCDAEGTVASYGTLHGWYRPLHLVDVPAPESAP